MSATHYDREAPVMQSPHDGLTFLARAVWGRYYIAGLAAALGRPRSTVACWVRGTRAMPAAEWDRLAEIMRQRTIEFDQWSRRATTFAERRRREPRKGRGFQVVKVRDASGIPRDGRWRER